MKHLAIILESGACLFSTPTKLKQKRHVNKICHVLYVEIIFKIKFGDYRTYQIELSPTK